jgi:pentatricopeptide repeat protein
LLIIEVSMYRSAARTKTICQILRRDIRRSGSLSFRNVGSSAVANTLTVSTNTASPCRQPFASVLISKFCTSNSEKFTHEETQSAAYIFEETMAKLAPYHLAMQKSAEVGNIQNMETTILEMRLNGLSPTEETYDYVVAAHIVKKDLKAARQTIDNLKDLGISHTTKIMITLMKAYSKVGDFDGTKKIYDEVIYSGFPPGNC